MLQFMQWLDQLFNETFPVCNDPIPAYFCLHRLKRASSTPVRTCSILISSRCMRQCTVRKEGLHHP